MPDEPRLKLAFVVHDFNRGLGHSRYVVELASRFKRQHEVHVFANTFDPAETDGIILHHVPSWRRSSLTTILSFILPATLMIGRTFDIVHAQGLCGLRHDIATAHMILPAWNAGLRAASAHFTWGQRISAVLVPPLERLALMGRHTKRVIAISNRVRDDIAVHYGRRAGIEVIYHGVDLELFNPRNRATYGPELRATWNACPTDVVALYVGHLQKGASAALKAVARVPRVTLAIASSSDHFAERQLASDLGIANRVRFLPFSKEVHRLFAAADVFLFPTIYDAFGMVISEAMASGLPPIVPCSAGASELIVDGTSGFVIEAPWDVDALAGALRQLVDDAPLRVNMGLKAREAIEAYSWDRAAKATMQLYYQLVAAP